MSKFEDRLFELKIQKSKQMIMDEIERRRSKTAVVWTAGRDSTCLLYLMKDIYGKVQIPVIFPDTDLHFKETYEFRDKIARALKLDLINVRPTISYDKVKNDKELCCYALKAEPVLRTVREQKFNALVLPLRRNAPRTFMEGYISKTLIDKMLLHFRAVEAIAHWTKKDILRFTEEQKIPLNPLYEKGYQGIFCKTCEFHGIKERETYNAKNAEKIVKRLESLGYL